MYALNINILPVLVRNNIEPSVGTCQCLYATMVQRSCQCSLLSYHGDRARHACDEGAHRHLHETPNGNDLRLQNRRLGFITARSNNSRLKVAKPGASDVAVGVIASWSIEHSHLHTTMGTATGLVSPISIVSTVAIK